MRTIKIPLQRFACHLNETRKRYPDSIAYLVAQFDYDDSWAKFPAVGGRVWGRKYKLQHPHLKLVYSKGRETING